MNDLLCMHELHTLDDLFDECHAGFLCQNKLVLNHTVKKFTTTYAENEKKPYNKLQNCRTKLLLNQCINHFYKIEQSSYIQKGFQRSDGS